MSLNAGAIATDKRMRMRGWNRSELARRANTSRATISRVLAGKRRPGRDLATKLSDLLGVDAHLWRTDVEGHPPSMTERKRARKAPKVHVASVQTASMRRKVTS